MSNPDAFNPEIVQKYDIRGIYNETLFEKDAYILGNALVGYYKDLSKLAQNPPTFAIGHDCRDSALPLKKALIQGICDRGGNVIDLGPAPTPVVNTLTLSSPSLEIPTITAGIIITASHNPAPYNGFKVTDNTGLPLYGEALKNLPSFLAPELPQSQKGHLLSISSTLSIKDWYVTFLLSFFSKGFSGLEKKTLIWDIGNGISGEVLKTLLKKLPGTHHLLNEAPDPSFPDHTPDPSVEENMVSLKQAVLDQKADLGFALDMDGDRLGVIDSDGTYWNGDLLSYLFSEELCKKQKRARVLVDIKSSQMILDRVQSLNGTATLAPTGHAMIKSLLKKDFTLSFAGEYSGHHYFPKEYCLVDDAFYSALKVCQHALKMPLSQRYQLLKKYPSTQQKSIHFSSHHEKEKAMNRVLETAKELNLSYLDIDGIRASFKNGWWLIRASNTEPILTYRCEGKTEKDLQEMEKQLTDFIKKAGFKE